MECRRERTIFHHSIHPLYTHFDKTAKEIQILVKDGKKVVKLSVKVMGLTLLGAEVGAARVVTKEMHAMANVWNGKIVTSGHTKFFASKFE